jgi:hypothetical protein
MKTKLGKNYQDYLGKDCSVDIKCDGTFNSIMCSPDELNRGCKPFYGIGCVNGKNGKNG